MSETKVIPVDDDVVELNQKVLDALLGRGAARVEVAVDRVDYLHWRGEIKVKEGFKE